jgi:hypothetical protein
LAPPAAIGAVSGDGQSARVTTFFSQALVARVADSAGNPVPGVGVTFTSPAINDGVFLDSWTQTFTATTDANGLASAGFMLGDHAGTYMVTAAVNGMPELSTGFTLTNTPGAPNLFTPTGDGQKMPTGAVLGTPLSVKVVDYFKNPIPGLEVSFNAPVSGPSGTFGSFSSVTVATNGAGVATAPAFTANSLSGSYVVTASIPGTPFFTWFTLTNLATPTLHITAAGGTYNGSAFAATATVGVDGNFAASLDGVAPSLTYYAAGKPQPGAPVKAGTCTVTASFPGSQDYASASASTSFVITPAPLTMTAADTNRVYGTPNPATFGVSYSGFVGAEGPDFLKGTLSFDTQATTTGPAGDYPLTPGGLTSDNYDITFVAGTLHVARADQTITWVNPAAITYGTPLSAAQLNASVSVVGPATAGDLTYTSAAGSVLHAGNGQTLSVTAAGTNNYNPATATVTIDVNPAVLTVKADDASRPYGAANPSFAATMSGFVNGDTQSVVVTGKPSLIPNATAASNVGTYAIKTAQGTLNATDYIFAFLDGTLSIYQDTTTTQITSSASTSAYGNAVTFTAKVTADLPGSGTPTGAMSFYDGAQLLGTVTLSAGVATLTVAKPGVGLHTIKVSYSGDSNFVNSTSATFTQTVLSAADQTTLLGNQVSSLATSGELSSTDVSGLTATLSAASKSLNAGNVNAGTNQLKAFINKVNALVNSRRLTKAQAQTLIDAAEQAIASALA